MSLLERVRKYHEEKGVSYKIIAQSTGISYSVMYNFTSGLRELKACNQEKLDEYLKTQGY